MKKQNTPLLSALLLLAMLTTFSINANAQPKTGGKNSGRSNNHECCRSLLRIIPPASANSGQDRLAPTAPVALYGDNKPGSKIEVWVLNAAGQAQDPAKWSLRNEGETMVVDLSALAAGKYTIQMMGLLSYNEYEMTGNEKTGSSPQPKLVATWEKVDVEAGMKLTCYPSLKQVLDCGMCLQGDDDCIEIKSVWKRGAIGAENRIAGSVPLKQNQKPLGELLKSAPPGETTIYINQSSSGELKMVSKSGGCTDCTLMIEFERKKH